MTIGEWIDRRERPVPGEFRPLLGAAGTASLHGLLGAAEEEVANCAARAPGDRQAAFHLLAADAYVTYASMLAVVEGAGAEALREAVDRVARGWWERLQ